MQSISCRYRCRFRNSQFCRLRYASVDIQQQHTPCENCEIRARTQHVLFSIGAGLINHCITNACSGLWHFEFRNIYQTVRRTPIYRALLIVCCSAHGLIRWAFLCCYDCFFCATLIFLRPRHISFMQMDAKLSYCHSAPPERCFRSDFVRYIRASVNVSV